MKINFIISSLKAGGAERVVAQLANYWSNQKHNVSILTFDKSDDSNFYHLDDKISVIQLHLYQHSNTFFERISNTIHRIKVIRSTLKKLNADVNISFMEETNILVSLSCVGIKQNLIVSDRVDPDFIQQPWYWGGLKRFAYFFSCKLVIQTQIVKQKYTFFKTPIFVINNPLNTVNSTNINYDSKLVVSVGRLEHQKNFQLLIRAFAFLKKNDWKLYIYGEGSLRNDLHQLINELELQDKVCLKGNTNKVLNALEEASIFAFSSQYEGYPNALIEGMSVGLACISTDCPAGPSEIIEDGKNGYLVENKNIVTFSKGLESLINDPNLRKQLGKQGAKISERLNIVKIAEEWEKIF